MVLLFILIGGYFAASEIALVSLREGQARRLAEGGKRGRAAARLWEDPSRFLSAVQIGVTFAGFFAASYGGATLAVGLQRVLVGWGLSEGLAGTMALVGVTLIVSEVSLVFGELVPKRLALQRPEATALVVAPLLDWIAKVSRPAIWLLSVSTNAVVRLLGIDPHAKADEVSEEELRDLVGSHEELTPEERRVLTDVFTATDRVLREVMVPRTEVDFLSGSVGVEEAAAYVANRPHSRYPVTGDSPDDVLGVVYVRDLLTAAHRRDHGQDGPMTVGELAREAPALPGSLPLVQALSQMRRRGHLAVIFDEYGGTDGIVTLEDLIEELVAISRTSTTEVAPADDLRTAAWSWTGSCTAKTSTSSPASSCQKTPSPPSPVRHQPTRPRPGGRGQRGGAGPSLHRDRDGRAAGSPHPHHTD